MAMLQIDQSQSGPDFLIGEFVKNSPFRIREFVTWGSYWGKSRYYIYLGERVDSSSFMESSTDSTMATAGTAPPSTAAKLVTIKVGKFPLLLEYKFYHKIGAYRALPKIYAFNDCGAGPGPGPESGGGVWQWRALVMEMLGPSLAKMFAICGNRFSIPTVAQIAIQLINIAHYLHRCGVVYRNVCPENFRLGLPGQSKWFVVHAVELERCKSYVDESGAHIPFIPRRNRRDIPFIVPPLFSSLNHHRGLESNRYDDLEAIGYMLIMFAKGGLPWWNPSPMLMSGNTATSFGATASAAIRNKDEIWFAKEEILLADLVGNLPPQFAEYMTAVYAGKFNEDPAYADMLEWFQQILAEYNLAMIDHNYDWDRMHQPKKVMATNKHLFS